MATEVTKIVDPGEGDGHDYHSLSLWEAGEQGDLTGARDEIAIAKCRATNGVADTDTAVLTIDGWITDATRYIKIWCDPAENFRHSGVWNAAKYRHVNDTYWVGGVSIVEDYVNIDGIQFDEITTYGGEGVICPIGVGVVNISNCIMRRVAASKDGCGVIVGATGTVNIWNTIIYGASLTVGILCNWEGPVVNAYNCTVVNCTTNAYDREGGTFIAKNCYGHSATADYYGTMTMTTCVSADATGSVGLQNIALNTTNFTNVTAGTEDFHLPLGSALIDVGTDLSATFTDDIDGETRTGTWDIGADEYVAAGLSIPVAMHHYQQAGGL